MEPGHQQPEKLPWLHLHNKHLKALNSIQAIADC